MSLPAWLRHLSRDALALVAMRGQLMQQLPTGSMLASHCQNEVKPYWMKNYP